MTNMPKIVTSEKQNVNSYYNHTFASASFYQIVLCLINHRALEQKQKW